MARRQRSPKVTREFIVLSESWYGPANLERRSDLVDDIALFVSDEADYNGEIRIEWIPLGDGVSPRIVAFDDGWLALQYCQDLLDWMATVDDTSPRVYEVKDALIELGFDDVTPEEPD